MGGFAASIAESENRRNSIVSSSADSRLSASNHHVSIRNMAPVMKWTSASRFVALREDKGAREVRRER